MNDLEIKKFYDKMLFPCGYSDEDLLFYESAIHNKYLEFINKRLTDNINVLDVGCGTGLITNVFAKKFPKSSFTAIDFSDSINHGKKYAESHNLTNVTWLQQNFLEYQSDKKYDVIICQGVLHHIPDYNKAIDQFKHLLNTNGTLLIGVYHPWGKFWQKQVAGIINWQSQVLKTDQLDHPFETSFGYFKISKICEPLKLKARYPRFIYPISFLPSGGLIIYEFRKE